MLNLFLALLLSSFGAESLKHSQEDSEPNKLQEAIDRISRLVAYVKSKLVYKIQRTTTDDLDKNDIGLVRSSEYAFGASVENHKGIRFNQRAPSLGNCRGSVSESSLELRDSIEGKTTCRAWWLSGKFGSVRPEGRRFESHSSRQSRHVGTLGKSFTRSCL